MLKEDLVRYAKEYVGRGLSVLPYYNSGTDKKPAVKWKAFQDRLPNNDEIESWGSLTGDVHGLQVVTGMVSGIVVVDFDDEASHAWAKEQGLPEETPIVKTGKGYHYWFKYPDGLNIRPSVSEIHDKVDIRGEGSTAVVPPSEHYSGATYTWLKDLAHPLAPLPEWVIRHSYPNYSTSESSVQEEQNGNTKNNPREFMADGEGRNNFLFKHAAKLRSMNFPESAAIAAINMLNLERCMPPLDDTDVTKLVASAYKYENTKIYKPSDSGNAERLKDKYDNTICYVEEQKSWYAFNGKRWTLDGGSQVYAKALEVVRDIPLDITPDMDEKQADAIKGFALKSESAKGLDAMIKLASKGMAKSIDIFDQNPWFYVTETNTMELKSGKERPSLASDYNTKCANASFKLGATCPIWENFVADLLGGNKEMISYLKKALGYSLTGSVREQSFFILYGNGENGKTTLLETVARVMGDYAMNADFDTFTVKYGEGPRNDIARMVGARFVFAAESSPGKELDSATMKKLTGGDTITARFLHKENFEFRPQFKIFLATNNKPRIKDDTKGMWRRMKLIPCPLELTEDKKDKDLSDKLYAERDGILQWMLDGLKLYLAEGLKDPSEVTEATAEYREEMDIFGRFLEECCDVTDKGARTSASELYLAWKMWCERNGEVTWTQTTFGLKLGQRKFDKVRGASGQMRIGIKLKDNF